MTAGPIAFVFPAGDWLDHRGCVGVDPSVFFVDVGGSTYALDNNEDAGVWGGTTPRERRAIRRTRRRLRVIDHGAAA